MTSHRTTCGLFCHFKAVLQSRVPCPMYRFAVCPASTRQAALLFFTCNIHRISQKLLFKNVSWPNKTKQTNKKSKYYTRILYWKIKVVSLWSEDMSRKQRSQETKSLCTHYPMEECRSLYLPHEYQTHRTGRSSAPQLTIQGRRETIRKDFNMRPCDIYSKSNEQRFNNWKEQQAGMVMEDQMQLVRSKVTLLVKQKQRVEAGGIIWGAREISVELRMEDRFFSAPII